MVILARANVSVASLPATPNPISLITNSFLPVYRSDRTYLRFISVEIPL
ncbi:MAG: hypothetical protein V7K53_09150 [Nostoc sp.]